MWVTACRRSRPRDQLGGRVAAMQGVRTVRADEQAGPAARLGQTLEERHALRVSPMQVVEHENARGPARQVADDLRPDSQTLLGCEAPVGEDRDPLVGACPADFERVEQQLEGATERTRVGLPGVNRGSFREPGDQLADETGLADACLAADQGDGRCGPPFEEPPESFDLGLAADHGGESRGTHRRSLHPVRRSAHLQLSSGQALAHTAGWGWHAAVTCRAAERRTMGQRRVRRRPRVLPFTSRSRHAARLE